MVIPNDSVGFVDKLKELRCIQYIFCVMQPFNAVFSVYFSRFKQITHA